VDLFIFLNTNKSVLFANKTDLLANKKDLLDFLVIMPGPVINVF
jgi:hypothetical protein